MASAAVAGWIWWVAIRGGERRAIITHSDEFVHHGAHAMLMYPWAPVFGRGYVLVAIIACILLARYRDTAAGRRGDARAADAAAAAGAEHAGDRAWWGWASSTASGRCCRGRSRWPPAPCVASAAARPWSSPWRRRWRLLLALRADQDFWREPTSWVVVAAIVATVVALVTRAASRHRARAMVAGVAADRGDAGRARPAQRRHRARRGPGRPAPAAPQPTWRSG